MPADRLQRGIQIRLVAPVGFDVVPPLRALDGAVDAFGQGGSRTPLPESSRSRSTRMCNTVDSRTVCRTMSSTTADGLSAAPSTQPHLTSSSVIPG
ncbi:hypothetical protein ACXDF8_22170 [Mycolicibacterium sp. CBM1]